MSPTRALVEGKNGLMKKMVEMETRSEDGFDRIEWKRTMRWKGYVCWRWIWTRDNGTE